jgi:hypothetical protein
VEQVYREFQAAGWLPAEDLIEEEVTYAGVLGHLDRYEAAELRLHDTKTTTQLRLEHIRRHGPNVEHVWQTNLYAAALATSGRPVRQIVIDYIARDTGNDHQCVITPDPEVVREALGWLRNVRDTDLDMLPRDRKPESAWCQHCPFFDVCWEGGVPGRDPQSVLYVEHPDGPYWVAELVEARAAKKLAAEREDRAKGALDALRPNDTGKSPVIDVGGDLCVQWTISSWEVVDTAAVKAEYEAAGVAPPMKPAGMTVLSLVAKPDGDQS